MPLFKLQEFAPLTLPTRCFVLKWAWQARRLYIWEIGIDSVQIEKQNQAVTSLCQGLRIKLGDNNMADMQRVYTHTHKMLQCSGMGGSVYQYIATSLFKKLINLFKSLQNIDSYEDSVQLLQFSSGLVSPYM